MPNKAKRKTRRQRLNEQGVDPSTKGDRGKCIVARMTENCPKLYQEKADLRGKVYIMEKEKTFAKALS